MNFKQKILKLTEGRRKSDVARAAGLQATQLNDYTAKGSLPRYDIAVRIARALSVDVEWLLDDSKDWPPPPSKGLSLQNVPDRELALEVARRHRLVLLNLLEAIDAAKKTDWQAEETRGSNDRQVLRLIATLYSYKELSGMFSAENIARFNHQELPGAHRPAEDFDVTRIERQVKEIQSNPRFVAASLAIITRALNAGGEATDRELYESAIADPLLLVLLNRSDWGQKILKNPADPIPPNLETESQKRMASAKRERSGRGK